MTEKIVFHCQLVVRDRLKAHVWSEWAHTREFLVIAGDGGSVTMRNVLHYELTKIDWIGSCVRSKWANAH